MQNEDDLRGLAKVMDFMRAISILFVVINIYWFIYHAVGGDLGKRGFTPFTDDGSAGESRVEGFGR